MRITLFAALLVILAGFLPASEPPRSPHRRIRSKNFMRAKLRHSQKVLEGLSLENYGMIAKHSQEMSLLSQASNWQVLQTPEYRQRSTEFRRSVDSLTDAARERNLDGATLAFVQVTMKCVSCHKYVRSVRMAKLDLQPERRRIAASNSNREVTP